VDVERKERQKSSHLTFIRFDFVKLLLLPFFTFVSSVTIFVVALNVLFLFESLA
jgi:hypothetical protein